MSRTYLLLQKKLHELKSDFTDLSNHPPETSTPNPVADEFGHRLVFVTNLLTAEIALHPSNPNHLVQIKGELDELEAAFRHRYARMNAFDDVHRVDGSVCSCTESGSNDGGEAEVIGGEEGLGVYESAEKFNEAVVPPTEPEKMFWYDQDMQCDDGRNEKVGGGSRRAWRREEFRVMAIWMMLGVILMVNFSNIFHII